MLAGEPTAALARLERAHHLASEADVPWAAFEALRMSAKLRLAGNRGAALRDATLARAIAHRQRWIGRQAAIEREHALAPLGDAGSLHGATLVMPPDALDAARQDGVARALLELSLAAAQVFDPEQQARVCLDHLVRTLGAERAYLFATEPGGDRLVFRAGRNAGGSDARELRGYSTTIVELVRSTRSAMVVSSSEEGAMLGSRSATAHDLRSILAGPLLIKDELAGVVYLDSRLSQGMFTATDVQTLAAISAHIAIALASARAAQDELRRQALEKDLAVTGAVQALLLPRSAELAIGSLELAASYRPATVSGGDWWWAERRKDGSALVLLGDVTGHGAGAAMVTAAVASAHRVLTSRHGDLPVGELLAAIHEVIRELCRGEYLMSLIALSIDDASGAVDAWSAGGPAPVIISAGSAAPRPLKLAGSPLGGDMLALGTASDRLGDGERLFAFTDGAFEIQLSTGRTIGTRRLVAAAQAVCGEPLDVARARIELQLDNVRAGAEPTDDTTFILAGRRGPK